MLINSELSSLHRTDELPVLGRMDGSGLYHNSLHGFRNKRGIPADLLRAAAKISPIARCIRRVQSGAVVEWSIVPKKVSHSTESDLSLAEKIQEDLMQPHWKLGQNTYRNFVYVTIRELLILGFAAIRRIRHDKGDRLLSLECLDGSRLKLNPDWTPDQKNVARYHYKEPSGEEIYISDRDLFLICTDPSADDPIGTSAVELAFPFAMSFIGLYNWQSYTTGNAGSDFILDLGDVSADELEAFRTYWNERIQKNKETPIAAGKGVMQSVKLGAMNDSGLFHQQGELVLRLIAQCFDLSPRDLGREDYTYANGGIAATASWQEAILPKIGLIVTSLQNEVLNRYWPGRFKIAVANIEPRNEQDESSRATSLWEKGVSTLRETRQMAGLDPLGDERDNQLNPNAGGGGKPPGGGGTPPGEAA